EVFSAGSLILMADTAVLAAHDPNRFAPIFVLAPARSYTSCIITMLGQHPDLVDFPELKLFSLPDDRRTGDVAAKLLDRARCNAPQSGSGARPGGIHFLQQTARLGGSCTRGAARAIALGGCRCSSMF